MTAYYTIRLPDEIDQRLNEIANARNITKGDAMKKAFALLSFAAEAEKRGDYVGIVKPTAGGEPEVVAKVTGL